MDLEYDQKFEEMKKYIPFLESMIKRLESTSSASTNPRQAQLDKIRSLRDLLLDKKKRMKMENLLKCEQVLVNLYAKVEQKDALPKTPEPHNVKKEDDLEVVRNKLKSVTTKGMIDNKETLPEISRASEIEETCTPGSKEPALFQRRPNKPDIPSTSTSISPSKSSGQSSKRNYTRVLVSPEPSPRSWSADEETNPDTPLFSRRSPKRRSPKRYSPSRERKKERKKSSKLEKTKKTKGLNITLNVPEESLDSLNTEDILSRIMNCNDNDMDIETLREAKRQILSELHQTGAKYDDISDLLLKSYKKNKSSTKNKDEVEEGELSDSESEAIESIYGGLNSSQGASNKTSDDKEQPRKIQICLVINSDEGKSTEMGSVNEGAKQLGADASDLEMYGEKGKPIEIKTDSMSKEDEFKLSDDQEVDKKDNKTNDVEQESKPLSNEASATPANFYKPLKEPVSEESNKTIEVKSSDVNIATETNESTEKTTPSPQKSKNVPDANTVSVEQKSDHSTDLSFATKDVEIPLLHESVPTVEKPKENVVSEIDILQALKNEILGESLSIPVSEAATPALHQPKLKKVADAKEIAPKKRISIEKYKEQSVLASKTKTPLFLKEPKTSPKDDLSKKQSLKLTMKECERFNFPVKLAIDDDDSSDEEADKVSINDIYNDIAPKSPDLDDSSDVPCTPPVIIPVDPIKTTEAVAPSRADVDMRTLPLLLPNATNPMTRPLGNKDASEGTIETINQKDSIQINLKPKTLTDPRMRRDLNQSVNIEGTPFPLMLNPERGPSAVPPPVMYPNMTPTRAPNMTPIRNQGMASNMAPNMTPSMTPNARSFEIEENMTQKHVYAPMFTPFDPRERETSVVKEHIPSYKPELEQKKTRWEADARDPYPGRKWDDRDPRASSMQRDGPDYQKPRYGDSYKGPEYNYHKNTKYSIDRRESVNRSECQRTPIQHFGRSDGPPPPSNSYGIPSLLDAPMTPGPPFGRSDCPLTPNHPFGRADCPPTPIHSFGRTDCPTTPSHPFGRSDCPSTPSHPFGRSDCPTTPSHPFGRSECPTTPSHSFGRGDMPMTPSHPFGRSDNIPRDPRLNRSSDYDKYQKNDRERNNFYRERNASNTGYKPDPHKVHNKPYDGPDSYRPYREKSVERHDYRNERYKYSSRDRQGQFNRESMSRREPSVGRGGRAVSRDVDNERLYSRDRHYGNKPENDHYNQNERSRSGSDFAPRRGFYRERSIGRSGHEENQYRASSRAPSVGRTCQTTDNDNRLSVKRDAGRSFTIDTSVNSTFQDFLDGKQIEVFDYTFDSRRQRAASVGRSLGRESSIGRRLPHKPKEAINVESYNRKRLDFRRASSVGRDIIGKEERSFKDIKADFERFKAQIPVVKHVRTNFENLKAKVETPKVSDKSVLSKKDERVDNFSNRKSRKDVFDNRSAECSKKPYSPRKNNRDPRLRRDLKEGNKNKVEERDHKHRGIVYSNDNITKGTILGSGYGVRNYKIPKIKRPVEEKEEVVEKVEPDKKVSDKIELQKNVASSKIEADKKSVSKTVEKKVLKKDVQTKVAEKQQPEKSKDEDHKGNKNIDKLQEKKTKEIKSIGNKKSVDNVITDVVEKVEKRVTRLSRKSESLAKPVSTVKTRTRKAVIYDSDSNEENDVESEKKAGGEISKQDKNLDDISNTTDDNAFDTQSGDQMDSSFGIDDLFSDNIVSDPVIDNINALIADLDNELGPTKIVTPTDFSNDLIENMLDSITNSGKEDTKSLNEDEKLNDISEVISNDLNQSGSSLDGKDAMGNASKQESLPNNVSDDISHSNTQVEVKKFDAASAKTDDKPAEKDSQASFKEVVKPKPVDSKEHLPVDTNVSNMDDVVTTTDCDKIQTPEKIEDKKDEQSDVDGCSTPDSTINSETVQNRISQESVPDSTNEVQNETHSVVSSTHDPAETTSKDNVEPSSSNKDSTPSLDSLGSILSILQNKSKIKELLSILGGKASENDKIKKKLEMLSEIVSDEDDDTKDSLDKSDLPQKDKESKDEVAPKSVNSEPKISKEENESQEKPLEEEKSGTTVEACEDTDKDDESTNAEPTENIEGDNAMDEPPEPQVPTKKIPLKRGRVAKRGKWKKNPANQTKRVTRSNFELPKQPAKKKQSRELLKLQEDIKEMFMKDEILNATGIRMCRLAKLVDDKKVSKDDPARPNTPAPLVVLEKAKEIEALEETILTNKVQKKNIKLKLKVKSPELPEIDKKPSKAKQVKPSKYKPGPKSKTKLPQKQNEDDPYEFESDSVSDMMTDETNDKSVDGKDDDSTGSESESLASSKSFGSSEVLSDSKKKSKRKRGRKWQSGIIKPKKKKKVETKSTEVPLSDDTPIPNNTITIPDLNCFTDKSYCFRKNVSVYSCRLCLYSGEDIVAHYKESHPHAEIPLSRMDPQVAKEAIEQCEEVNFQAISKIPTDKYVCRFCYKEFARKNKNILESFFWHVVSMHTGEYKKLCSECVNVTPCPFNLDIPPPPKDVKGQLIGYICEKCNFTQISLENLKTHVIVRHNDEQTEVYTINLAVMTRKSINTLLKRFNTACQKTEPGPRVLRSTRASHGVNETSDDQSDSDQTDGTSDDRIKCPKIKIKKRVPSPSIEKPPPTLYQTKITYENDDNMSDALTAADKLTTIKIEKDYSENDKAETVLNETITPSEQASESADTPPAETKEARASKDIFDYPHFKISYSETGLKEYVCCINGKENHYKTTLLISMKKHVQIKHSELWDGYCFVCKVIVIPQGQQHAFKECLQHFLDKHMDDFPVLEKVVETEKVAEAPAETPQKSYINVRPLSELISNNAPAEPVETEIHPMLPKIESIVSLGAPTVERVASPASYPSVCSPAVIEPEEKPQYKYEEVQAEVMSKKHQVVLETMMSREKLINVYKCAGRFCSFTSDSVEDALLHASTHNRVGGDGSLSCAYCDFDCSGNAIDLVMHVFKSHGSCQYVCGYCFYRSAASQLVTAHISKAHPGMRSKVLASTVVPPTAAGEHTMLPREAIVRYYVCPHACKYRTYTAQKFCEHIIQRHANETWHSCYICSEASASAAELVTHMKTHELNVYQCTWCMHGADNEAKLLAHQAATHPDKQPQAYLRLITNKGGTKEFRVLPLASFNKTKVDVEKVTPATNKDNPVREAERSIELETLIGHTTQLIESMATPSAGDAQPCEEPASQPDETAIEIHPPRLDTPPPMTIEERSNLPTPVLKTELPDTTPKKNNRTDVVYCLDSDDEDSRPPEAEQSVIDLSDDDAQPKAEATEKHETYRKVPQDKVFKCPKCLHVCKRPYGFKTHIISCGLKDEPMKCAHCTRVVKDRDELIEHYTLDHCLTDVCVCEVCDARFAYVGVTKKHMKDIHKITKVLVKSKMINSRQMEYRVAPTGRGTPAKRKLSAAGAESPAKKRYGPQDVDRLPINPILDESVHCALCEFNTKVRVNMVRHLQFHAEQQPAPHTAPVNPVPHLETNERHFDKMVNLAASSMGGRPAARDRCAPVPAQRRHACGAPHCSYISLDEDLLQRHWDTLHAALDAFRCAHCPALVPLDAASRSLNFARIADHLRLHADTLYGCSACAFCHYTRPAVAAHVADAHGGAARLVVVRQASAPAPAAAEPAPPGPTMDLKPWQCGLCEFRSLLRQEIVEHCGRAHQSKMQYKCAACPFRTSTLENVTKHAANAHPGRPDEVFYFFYREGSVPDEGGVPLWVRQRQAAGIPDEIKKEVAEPSQSQTPKPAEQIESPPVVDLNIVKKEAGEGSPGSLSIEALCQRYGQFCEPNGLNYKCPLCSVVMEDTREAMQSHLYEELRYRRWVCGTCSYKAFHSVGLNEHIISEHRGMNQSPVQLPSDHSIEKWVSALLDHQTEAIGVNKDTLAKQKIVTERPPRPTKPVEPPKGTEPKTKLTMAELEKAFGPLGVPSNMVYCCPKCNIKIKDEATMRNHLESELTKIRWCCSSCAGTFQTYHEAQFHCKSAHAGLAARPREAERSPKARQAWLDAVLQVQKLSMRCLPLSGSPEPPAPAPPAPEPEDSLLMVLYEERVPNPEEGARPRPADSDDDRLVIDEPRRAAIPVPAAALPRKNTPGGKCPHCDYQTRFNHVLSEHICRHYGLKPFTCTLCPFSGHKTVLQQHIEHVHDVEYSAKLVKRTELPAGPPPRPALPARRRDDDRLVCLVCEKTVPAADSLAHRHPDRTAFAKKGAVIIKCTVCYSLWADLAALREHFTDAHPGTPVNYLFQKPTESRDIYCGYCGKRFSFVKDLRAHNAVHDPLPVRYTHSPPIPPSTSVPKEEDVVAPVKRKADDTDLPEPKRIAKKSTTKLPFHAVARKSTTKLPFNEEDRECDKEYSFYGTKPVPLEQYRNVSVLMSFCNTMVPFTMDKLSGVLNINPKVVLEDVIKKDHQ